MYCQKLIVNTLRYFRIVTRSSAFANICSLNQRKNMFMTYLQQINKIKNNYSTNKRKNLPYTRDYIISGIILSTLFPKEEKKEKDVEELIMTIKRSILLIQVRLTFLYYYN